MFNWKKGVAADLFDDELIVVNLNEGFYYSIQGPIVNLLISMPFEDFGLSFSNMNVHLSSNKCDELVRVWKALLEEGLVKNSSNGIVGKIFKSPKSIKTNKPSKLSRYADMKDLILLDPIHEVDEEGWPVVQES